ncbi:hypothetical protein, partial [Phocaeicola sartorii]|uniref:hypothetical protein n=1 Tax=Phocaeicola sartorii TaxID=671267 RepID=UPI001C878035
VGGGLCRVNIHSSLRKRRIFDAKILIFSQKSPYLREKLLFVPSIFYVVLQNLFIFDRIGGISRRSYFLRLLRRD